MNSYEDAKEFLAFLSDNFDSYEDRLEYDFICELTTNFLKTSKSTREIVSRFGGDNPGYYKKAIAAPVTVTIPGLDTEPDMPEEPEPEPDDISEPLPDQSRPGQWRRIPEYTYYSPSGSKITVPAHERFYPAHYKKRGPKTSNLKLIGKG